MALWGLLTGLRSKIAVLTGLGSGVAGGVFKSYLPVYLGGRFGSAHFGVDRFRAVDHYAWQLSKLLTNIDSTFWNKPLYRWDVAQNAWLRVETQAHKLVWGQTKWGHSTW